MSLHETIHSLFKLLQVYRYKVFTGIKLIWGFVALFLRELITELYFLPSFYIWWKYLAQCGVNWITKLSTPLSSSSSSSSSSSLSATSYSFSSWFYINYECKQESYQKHSQRPSDIYDGEFSKNSQRLTA